jgi:hypothetical protein
MNQGKEKESFGVLGSHRTIPSLFLFICAFDVVAFSKFPSLCGFATGAMVFGMVLDHKNQGTKTGQKDLKGH